jgi:flagellar motility protein MotE (MotC chaperone)
VVKLVVEAVDNDEAYACVERMLEKHVQNIKRCSSTTLNNEAHMSLPSGNEAAIHIPSVENLLEIVKGIKKKEGRKGGKRIKGWVENQKKTKQNKTKQKLQQIIMLGEKISQVTFYLYKFTFILYNLLNLIHVMH